MSQKTMEKELSMLAEIEEKARLGGGAEKQEQQRKMGKMTCRERIEYFLDPGSFVELNMLAEHQCNDFGMEKKRFPGDGGGTGYGTIYGRKGFLHSGEG